MHCYQLIALSSVVQQCLAAASTEAASCRHIWQQPPGKDIRIKFLDVPNTYDDELVKHADLVGMIDLFTDGQTWLMMDGKRLFRIPSDGTADPTAVQHSTEVELMTPEELREVLKTRISYDEAYAKLTKIMQDYQASGQLKQRVQLHCGLIWCHGNHDCFDATDSDGACNSCRSHDCRWNSRVHINAIRPSPYEVGEGGNKDQTESEST